MLSAIVLAQNLRWLLPTTFMLGVAPAYISIWAVWRVISVVLPRSAYVKGDDFLFSTYQRNLLFYFEVLTGVELQFYGDLSAVEEVEGGENCIYMSNHQTTMDWVIATSVAKRRGCVGRVRYILKDGLKFLPFYGVYLGLHGSLFVKKAGKFRKDVAEKKLRRDAEERKPMWLVIFPEGTRYNPEMTDVIENSKDFADEQGLQPFESVLYPRVRAMQVCVEQLKDSIDSVYDVTIAYSSAFDFKNRRPRAAPTMQDFLMGWCPKVHVHLSRISVNDVPADTNELRRWLYERFQLKDRLLQEFYSASCETEAKFSGPCIVKPIPLSALFPSVLLWGGIFTLFNYTSELRAVYWKVGLAAAVGGLVWSGVRF